MPCMAKKDWLRITPSKKHPDAALVALVVGIKLLLNK